MSKNCELSPKCST